MMIGRRQWMAGGAALATTFAAGPLMAKGLKAKPIGIQLYTVRELFANDPMGTLEKVAAIGYREVEYGGGGYDKMDHAALRKTMDRLGLTSPSIHVGYESLASDSYPTWIEGEVSPSRSIVLRSAAWSILS